MSDVEDLRAELGAQTRRARVTAEFVERASEAADDDELLRSLSQAASDAVAGSLAIYRLTPDGRELEVVALTSHEHGIADAFRAMYARQRWRADEGFMGRALTTRKTVFEPCLSPDARASYLESLPADRRPEMAARDLRAIIAVPLSESGRQIGILTLARYGPDAAAFSEADRAFAEDLATRTNVALGRIALADERQREAERKRLLAEFLASAVQASDERSIFEELAQRTSETLGATCVIYRATADGTELDVIGVAGHGQVTSDDLRTAFTAPRWRSGEGVSGRAYATGEPVLEPYFDDASRAAYLASLPAERARILDALDLRAIMSVPLQGDGRRIGALTIGRHGPATVPFEPHDLAFAEELAERASVALTRLALVAERERTARVLQTVFEASPLATYLLDHDRRVRLWNRAAERLFGYTADEVIGGFPPTLPAEEGMFNAVSGRVERGEIVNGIPARRVRKDGTVVDVELYGAPVPDEQGETGLLGIYADVTERNRLQRELRRTSATLRAILDASPLPIIAVDDALRVTFWNKSAEVVYGWTADEVIGHEPPYAPEHDPGAVGSTFSRVRAGETVEAETARRTKSGRTISIRFVSAPLFDENGRFRGALGISQDITEQKRLEAELLQAQKMETVGRLAGGVAHDFNNILTAIIGYADLGRTLTADPEMEDVLETVKAAAERAAGLTQQLLAFSRRQMLRPQPVEANDVVLGMEQILRRLIGEDIELVASVEPNAGAILVDRTQLEQVILNLAVNARDAMPDGGRLVLRTETAQFDGDGNHLEMPPGDYVAIHVSDTGVGMDEETKAHIFEPFFTTKEVGKGTGLGLATTYGIVRQSGGYVWVYSEPGRGTIFKLYFPRVGGSVAADLLPAPEPGTRRGRVLLVEDEPTLRDLVRLILSRRGFEVVVARDPPDAIERAREAGPLDLLVTDVVMPGTTGIELARRLRESRPELRVLFMSGYSEDVTDAAGTMVRRFLAKPFTPDALLRAVDDALGPEAPER